MTLNQILQRIKQLAENHPQINYFFVGAADEFLDQQDVTYPALFCELQPNANLDFDAKFLTYNFKIYIFDLLNVSDKALLNQWEVTSDTSSIAQDFLALITDNTFTDWYANSDYNLSIEEYKLQDLCCGVTFDVAIGIPFDANRCQVPTTYNWDVIDDNGEFTLNQILNRCEALALSHDQVNSYVLGRFDRFLDGADIVYPAVFADFGRTGRISLTDRLASYDVNFHFFDLMDISANALNNEFEVKSDMIQVAIDFAAMLLSNSFKWIIGSSFDIQIKDYQLQDLTAGVTLKATISSWYDANKCQVPSVEEVGNFILWNDTDKILINDTEKLLYA